VPELPEVETVRSGLAPSITSARVDSIEIFDVRSLRRHLAGHLDFVATLTGRKVLDVVRRGKFLWMPLEPKPEDGEHRIALVGHLGMSGQMLLRVPGHAPDKLTRILIHLTEASGEPVEFRFVDQRLFGGLFIDALVPTPDSKPGGFSAGANAANWWEKLIPASAVHIARDPLDPAFDSAAVIAKLRTKNTGIKRALLDQALISGIGNIYADESLWQAKLHYDQPGASIGVAKLRELLAAVGEILERAVRVGGTSFDEQYKNVNGESGYFEISLNAYGRKGKPCSRCNATMVREEWANRGSHFCPKCQRLKP
jgi:formamidopyrimidine-DNA glycosylase